MSTLYDTYLGKTVLVTTSDWFIAPDGLSYQSVFGTLQAVHLMKDVIPGAVPTRTHANYLFEIGNMLVMGCRVSYIIRANKNQVKFDHVLDWSTTDAAMIEANVKSFSYSTSPDGFPTFKAYRVKRPSKIYNADN